MKTTTAIVVALAATVLLFAGGAALGQMGGWGVPGGPWGGMMGGASTTMGGMGGMMGGGHCPMMGGGSAYATPRETPVTATEAKTLAQEYIQRAGLNLTAAAVKERRTVFEVETLETDGTPGIGIFVGKRTGAVWPEMGPQAMGGFN